MKNADPWVWVCTAASPDGELLYEILEVSIDRTRSRPIRKLLRAAWVLYDLASFVKALV